jgi:hypothetical protein
MQYHGENINTILKAQYYNEIQILLMNQMAKSVAIYIEMENS